MGWQNGALCCGLTNLYYSEKGNSIEAIVNKTIAKTICSICSCQQQCQEEYDSLPIENQIGIWSGGKILDPKEGEYYNVKLTTEDGKKMDVRGYIGIPLLGRTQVWYKAEQQ